MKYATLFFAILLFASCEDTSSEDTLIISENLHYDLSNLELGDNTSLTYQNRQTDFNFLLRAHFPPQIIEFHSGEK